MAGKTGPAIALAGANNKTCKGESMRYRELSEEIEAAEITELDPYIWQGLDLWLADWKEEV